jgi:uncharacterized protein (TIGR03643 family)
MKLPDLDAASVGEVIALALSDHVGFSAIQQAHGLTPDQVKALMRRELKPGSYQAWRKRVRTFSDQRAVYK